VNDDLVTVIKLYFDTGDSISRGQDAVEFETSKTNVTVASESDGFVRYLVDEGTEVPVGTVLARVHDTRDEALAAPARHVAAATPGPGPAFSRRARELSDRHELSASLFAGLDFVTEDDVRARMAQNEAPSVEPIGSAPSALEKVPLSSSKRTEIRYLSAVQQDLTSTVSAYIRGGAAFERVGGLLQVLRWSYLPLVVYELARLLRKHRVFNAYFDDDGIVYHSEVGIGFAVDIGKGLRVPVIRAADEMTLPAVEDAILDRVEAYERGTLGHEHLAGGTFTITDLSSENVAEFTPLINARQSAILGIASLDPDLGRTLLSLTFDHRVTEAKAAAALLRDLIGRIESYGPGSATAAPVRCDRCFKTLAEDRALEGFGLAKIVRHDGSEGLLCALCLAGY
jgi:pyruvate/2-oxoglutarate dehydrogenase complex dihydrolipoamide acyltransferase (E2) component